MDDFELDFDELNNVESENRRSIPYDTYFGEMDLTDEQKDRRIETAKKIETVMLFAFALYMLYKRYNRSFDEKARQTIKDRYKDEIQGLDVVVDDYINQFISDDVDSIIDTTEKNPDNEFNLSDDRAMLIAENDANSILNYDELAQAIKQGKTKKTWITMQDKHVRHTHRTVDNKTIRITDVFSVGNSLMMFPKDESMGADMEEISNCRCSIKYS